MWRHSLREMLGLVAITAVAIVSLKYATYFWYGVVGLAVFVVFTGALIAAIFARGGERAFAVGMLLAMTSYGALLACAKYMGGISDTVTSTLLDPLYRSIVEYEDVKESGTVMRQIEHPEFLTFLMIGHYWWALLLGYVGGRFARFTYGRRERVSLADQRP